MDGRILVQRGTNLIQKHQREKARLLLLQKFKNSITRRQTFRDSMRFINEKGSYLLEVYTALEKKRWQIGLLEELRSSDVACFFLKIRLGHV